MLIEPIKNYKVGGTPHKIGDKPYRVDRNHGEMLVRNNYAREVKQEAESKADTEQQNSSDQKKKQTKK